MGKFLVFFVNILLECFFGVRNVLVIQVCVTALFVLKCNDVVLTPYTGSYS